VAGVATWMSTGHLHGARAQRRKIDTAFLEIINRNNLTMHFRRDLATRLTHSPFLRAKSTVEQWPENGGTMAKVTKKLTKKKTKTRGESHPTGARKKGSKPRLRAKKPETAKAELDREYNAIDVRRPDDDQNADGEELLRTYTSRLVAKRSIQMAKRLTRRAEEGNLTSAKLVLELVKKKNPKKPSAKCLTDCVSTYEGDRLLTRRSTPATEQIKERNA
jgi:hypothetical protein